MDDDEDDDEPDAGEDSDADSWLVDDHGGEEDEDDDMESVDPMDKVDPTPHPKRHLEGSGPGTSHKKRRVVRLVPFVRGPVWDPAITNTVEVFSPYRIRFFNGMWLAV